MELDDYLPMFLAECREHLQDLNLALVALEEAPDDRERIDEIFRIAHSLKGMSATMGFAGMAELTHEMENVFELLRQRRGGLEREAIDLVLACLDALSAAVDAVEQDGRERIDAAALVERLQALVRAPAPPGEPAGAPADLAQAAGEAGALAVSVQLADDVAMPAVRAFMVLAALGEHGELLAAVPSEAEVDEFDGRLIEAVLASDHEDDAIVAAVREVEGVAQVTIASREAPPAEAGDADADADPDGEPAAPAAGAAGAPAPRRALATVRVDAERLDQLMHYMGELVVHRTQLESLVAQSDVPGIAQAMQDVTRSSQTLRAMVMKVRMIEVEAVFLRLPRLVRDLSGRLGKQVDLRLAGAETELDRTVVDALGDPLVHLVRNALDHGLESPEERAAAGKPPTGTLEISARHAGGSVVIAVRDDGRGIDPQAVARTARSRGLIGADDPVDLPRAIELLFAPGFSTASETSDISGRGVGMDAVRETVRALGGEVALHSEPGQGTSAQIRLPLTLAIMAALVVEVGDSPFAIPLDRVERTLRLEEQTIRSAVDQPMLMLPDGVLPLRRGADAFDCAAHGADDEYAVVLRAGEQRVALAVDELVGQRELVTRPLPPELASARCVSGGAVLSDGGIALLVDCDALLEPIPATR